MEIIKDILAQLLPLVLTVIIPYLGVLVGRLIKGGFEHLKASTKSLYLKQLVLLCEEAVLASYQTILKRAKEKFSDGKITSEEYAKLKMEAKAEAMKMVKHFLDGVPVLIKDFLQDKADGLIEGAIPKVKAKQRGIPVNPTVPAQDGK